MERINRGFHRHHMGRNRFWVGVRGPNFNAHTNQYRQGSKKNKLNNGTLCANVLGMFSQAPAYSWPLYTDRRHRFATTPGSSLLEGWECGAWQTPSSSQTSNCVKLLRWQFFHILFSISSFRIAYTVNQCVSAQKPWIVAAWVWMGGYGLLVGEWVVSGCVLLPLFLGSLSLLSDARQRTNLEWWVGWYRSVGVDWWVSELLGASFYHHHHLPPPTFPC